MPPVPKHIKASRNNGGKAKNKGKLTGNKVTIIREKIGVTPPAGEHTHRLRDGDQGEASQEVQVRRPDGDGVYAEGGERCACKG